MNYEKLIDSIAYLQLALDEVIGIFPHSEKVYLEYAEKYLSASETLLGETSGTDIDYEAVATEMDWPDLEVTGYWEEMAEKGAKR